MYVVYPLMRPLREYTTWMPWMQYEELSEDPENEMNDLLRGQEVQQTVNINGKEVVKRLKTQKRKKQNMS